MTPADLARAAREHQLPPLVCLHGSETYLLQRAFEQVREATVPEDARDFNYQQFDGKEVDPGRLLDEAQTLPVFAPRRMIVVHNAHKLSASTQEAFLPYLQDPAPETLLLLIGEKIDGRRKFFQHLRKKGMVVEFKPLYENQLPGFIRQEAQRLDLEFTEDGMRTFCRRVGTGLQEIVGELLKLQNYLGGAGIVDSQEVLALVSDSRQDSIFDLTNALGTGNTARALALLRRMLDEGEPPLRILTMIVRHYRQLRKTADALKQGLPKKEMARHVGINPYFLDGLVKQARENPVRYKNVMEACLATDLALKSSGAHPEALMERLLYDLAGYRQKAGQ